MIDEEASAFQFHGTWRDYAPIAFTNLALTIVTLGFYRFWAKTRTRRYLWSHTHFIDDWLEYTGTGKELFIGFLMAAALFGLPFLFLQFGAQALLLQGYGWLVGILTPLVVLFLYYLIGLARFRALRYRLSRTHWHGIRGGSENAGWLYGWSYIWKNFVGFFVIGLLLPWAMVSLWNERWRQMSFGPQTFQSDADSSGLMKRFFLIYLTPFIAAALTFVLGDISDAGAEGVIGFAILGIVLVYLILPLLAIGYYAAFFREGVNNLSLGDIDFGFDARTKQWLLLFLGDIALVVCTLGIGLIFLEYRHWKFFITHLHAYGEVSLEALTQSTTKVGGHGEGLLDALDVGAF